MNPADDFVEKEMVRSDFATADLHVTHLKPGCKEKQAEYDGPATPRIACPCYTACSKSFVSLLLPGEVPRFVANRLRPARSGSGSPVFQRRWPDQANPVA